MPLVGSEGPMPLLYSSPLLITVSLAIGAHQFPFLNQPVDPLPVELSKIFHPGHAENFTTATPKRRSTTNRGASRHFVVPCTLAMISSATDRGASS
jgi:hypothetical protein